METFFVSFSGPLFGCFFINNLWNSKDLRLLSVFISYVDYFSYSFLYQWDAFRSYVLWLSLSHSCLLVSMKKNSSVAFAQDWQINVTISLLIFHHNRFWVPILFFSFAFLCVYLRCTTKATTNSHERKK